MRIEWVNHASFIFHDGEASIICDPWLSGPAFNKGWELLSPSRFSSEDFERITHIWFSHEHPDHFYPPNIRSIPEAYRRRITVLYHWTRDKRVLKMCKGLGFRVQELSPMKPFGVSSRTELTCGPNGIIDSWLAIRSGGKLILNLNDCVFDDDAELRTFKRVFGNVDVLLTQFSYANWVGNPDDVGSHRRHAERKREQIAQQVRLLQPGVLIPFASFVVFAHEENFAFNTEANRIGDIYRFTSGTLSQRTVVLYPGDSWDFEGECASESAIARYDDDLRAALSRGPVHHNQPYGLQDLKRSQANYFRKTKAKNRVIVLRMIPASTVYVRDLGVALRVSFDKALEVVDCPPERTDLILSSDSLNYCFSYDWGGDALAVNGRYEVPSGANAEKFFWNFRPGMYNATGQRLGYRFMLSQALRRVRRSLRPLAAFGKAAG